MRLLQIAVSLFHLDQSIVHGLLSTSRTLKHRESEAVNNIVVTPVCCYLRSFLVYNSTLKHIWIYSCVSFWQKSCLWVCCWCFTPLNTWAPGALIKKALSGSRMATNTLVLPKFPSLWQESILQLSSRNYFCIKDYLNVNHWLLGSQPRPI